MRKLFWAALILFVTPIISFSQEETKEDFGIKWSGFIRNDVIYNSRQVLSARNEGQFLLAPLPISLDANGDDINATPNLNIIGINTRLKGNISAPDAFGAKTSGYIEADFFGKDATTSFGLRMRHAFMKLKWDGTELLTGQYWNPAFTTDCFPGTVSFGAGVPFNPLSRNPQIRFTRTFGGLKVFAAILGQGHFKSKAGYSSAMNAGIPEAHLQVQFANKKEDGTGFYAGAGFFYKSLMPSTSVTGVDSSGTSISFKTDATVSGISALAYTKIVLKPITVKLYGMYGQMNDNMVMMGGYAYQYDTTAVFVTGERYDVTYTPYNTLSTWCDIHTNGKKVELGVFVGYNKNLGLQEDIADAAEFKTVGRWTNVESMMRIAPRVVFKSGKMNFGFELEYSTVNYGTIANKGAIENIDAANNIKALFSATYNF